jgi:hypothetical protein
MEDVEVEKDLGEKGILTKVTNGSGVALGKKPRTEKQIEAFKKASAIRDANRNKRKEDGKKEMEEKILKKAISIKKKQIKKAYTIDDISDDETPIEQIRAMTPPPQRPIQQIQQPIIKKPQFYFL